MSNSFDKMPDADELEIINKISNGELSRLDNNIQGSRESLKAMAKRVSFARDLGFIGRLFFKDSLSEARKLEDGIKGLTFARKHLIVRTMEMAAFHREREKLGYRPMKGSPNNKPQAPAMAIKALAAAAAGPSTP